ncbi:MAG: hypothetical protein ACKVS9_08725, partial [Phycisphaerae bacterium]
MGLQIIALLLVLAITFMHSIFGLYSGLINVFCSVAALCVSLGFWEPMTDWMSANLGLSASYSGPVSVFLLFFGTLIGLRQVFDQYVRGNVHVPAGLDTTGAVICGAVNAQIAVGMLATCAIMLPIGAENVFVRYERHPTDKQPDRKEVALYERQALWLRSDDFAVGLFKLMSAGSLKGDTTFASVYPSFVDAVYYTTNTVQPESAPAPYRDKKGGDGFKNGIKLETWWEQKTPVDTFYRADVPTAKSKQPPVAPVKFAPSSGNKVIGARVSLAKASADRSKSSATHMFRTTQIRIVGTDDGVPAHFIPSVIGGADVFTQGKNRLCDPDTNFSLPAESDRPIDVYFEVPTSFKPAFIEYRRHARAAIGGEPAASPPSNQIALGIGGEPVGSGSSGGGSSSGRLAFGDVLESGSGDSRGLPFDLNLDALKRVADLKLAGDEIVRGRFSGGKARLGRSGEQAGVKLIKEVPGKKIVQLTYQPKQMRSIVGEVFNFVGSTVNQFVVRDDRGGEYRLAGYYAVVKRGNDEHYEFFFNGDPDKIEEQADPSYKFMLDFKDIKRNEINDFDNSKITLIFVVNPGVKIVRLQNQAGDGG